MKKLRFILFLVLILNACKKQKYPEYANDWDTKGYSGSILARNLQHVFLNSKNAVVRMNLDGKSPIDLIGFTPSIPLPELVVKDSVLVLTNTSNLIYLMSYNGLINFKVISNRTIFISEAIMHNDKMLVLSANHSAYYSNDQRKRGGYLELFDCNVIQKALTEIPGFYKGLYSDGFFSYHDSIIYSYDYTTNRGSIKFSRFNINDAVPNIEIYSFKIGSTDNVRICVSQKGDDMFVSDGANVYICTLEQNFFVLKKKI